MIANADAPPGRLIQTERKRHTRKNKKQQQQQENKEKQRQQIDRSIDKTIHANPSSCVATRFAAMCICIYLGRVQQQQQQGMLLSSNYRDTYLDEM